MRGQTILKQDASRLEILTILTKLGVINKALVYNEINALSYINMLSIRHQYLFDSEIDD